jgi:hypothetical protein
VATHQQHGADGEGRRDHDDEKRDEDVHDVKG